MIDPSDEMVDAAIAVLEDYGSGPCGLDLVAWASSDPYILHPDQQREVMRQAVAAALKAIESKD